MAQVADLGLSEELLGELEAYVARMDAFRAEGVLDPVALEILREHFRAAHVYHSAGIEGNHLTLQETIVVLKEGVDVTDRPLRDAIEVKNLGDASDFMTTLCAEGRRLSESDLRALHGILLAGEESANPGQYRSQLPATALRFSPLSRAGQRRNLIRQGATFLPGQRSNAWPARGLGMYWLR
jgi:Fic family protein